jgi:hypothetical protein
MTLQSFKKLTEEIGEEILTKAVFDSLFNSDYSNDGQKSTLRYRLELRGYLPNEPSHIRDSKLENRLYTNDGISKSNTVKQIGIIGDEFNSRLMVLASKKEINNFYVAFCTAKCRDENKEIKVKEWQGIHPQKSALCINKPHFITCLNLEATLPDLRYAYAEKFLTSFFKMIKKYA